MTEEKCASYAKEFHSKHEKETSQDRTLFLEKVKAEECEFRERPNNKTVIQRACRSFSFDSMGTIDLCNSGDGRKLFILVYILDLLYENMLICRFAVLCLRGFWSR